MLYVFHVDGGQMTTYDMNLTLQSVATLKDAIERKTRIPATSVVLLVSGGEVLQSDHMVSSYSAGTDSNPIYMFSKPLGNQIHLNTGACSGLSPIVEVSTGEFRSYMHSVAELRAAVDKCCSMTPSVNTVNNCAVLAQKFKDLAFEVSRSCEQLVHDQHLQHQGWAAVVANLDDIFSEFCERSRNFKESFKKHRLKKEEYHRQFKALNDVLESLGKIPILPALQLNAEAHRFSAFDVSDPDFEGQYYRTSQRLDSSYENRGQDFGVEALRSSEEDVFANKESTSSKDVQLGHSSEPRQQIEESDEGVTFKAHSHVDGGKLSLLHWILAQGNKESLHDIVDYCEKGLDLIESEPLKEREAELCNMLECANVHGLKQIKGIEDRLSGLNQLLSDVKKREREQHDQATSLTQYRDRLTSACDPSVLPTLVQSHFCQLEKLLKGHQYLIDIKRRIAKSKDELSHILKARLEAVLMIENSMSIQDAHAMLNFQCLNRLARYFDIVAQLHRAPNVFVHAVHEVARRRTFSQAHLTWATDIAEKLLKIHNDEVLRRQQFNAIFEGHFLKSLFPGMSELPPPFAVQAPPPFDARLPKLTEDDAKYISDAFPDLAKDIPNYDMDSIVKFFQQRLLISEHKDKDTEEEQELKDNESETETGDFEKLGEQSTHKLKVDTSTICVPDTLAVSTVTEDNMDTHRINIEKLHGFLKKLFLLCRVNISFIKEEFDRLKEQIDEQKKLVNSKYLELLEAWNRSNVENAIKFREQTQRLTVDHELELSDMKDILNSKDEVIDSLKKATDNLKTEHLNEKIRLENKHQETRDLLESTREEIAIMEAKLQDAEVQKQKNLKDLQEKMHQEYKAEIESLRSRFRLVAVTNMDRSPSESSLERIERTDVIEISSHNAIVMQTKENAEVEKEEAVREAVEKCEAEWSKRFSEEMMSLKAKYESNKQSSTNDVTRRLLLEKDRQLELLREREQALMRESVKYRDTIQQLTDLETNDADNLLKCQMATLENEKSLLQQVVADLTKQLERKTEELEKKRDEDSEERSSPKREESKRTSMRSRSHTPYGLAAGTLSLASCLPGHTVLVMWDPAHLNYTVMQEASIMYFVHSDCLPALGLSIQVKNESERRLYAIGVVESKDYCYAKKSGNRYHMPFGSRFYRVQVRPLRPHLPPPPCCDHKHKQDMQKSVDISQSISTATDDSNKVSQAGEVATATLINLESPVSTSEAASTSDAVMSLSVPSSTAIVDSVLVPSEDQLDSIEMSDQWQNARTQMTTNLLTSDMECSVGQVGQVSEREQTVGAEPLELTVAPVAVVARGNVPPGSELAEEAEP